METQTKGLEDARLVIKEIAQAAVEGLAISSNKPIYADRLSLLGLAIVPYLEMLYTRSPKGELRTTAAILLLHLGSRLGLPEVFDSLTPDDPNSSLAASKLANAGVSEADGPIINLLRAVVLTGPLTHQEAPQIETLLDALKKLEFEIPNDITERLKAPGVSRFISGVAH